MDKRYQSLHRIPGPDYWCVPSAHFFQRADRSWTTTAKRAYLGALFSPPPILSSPTASRAAQIKPYSGPDAQNVIQAVNSRGGNPRGHRSSVSVSIGVGHGFGGAHTREGSGKSPYDTTPTQTIPIPSGLGGNREPSPTLPNLPTHPDLSSLISSSLGGPIGEDGEAPNGGAAPRIGDPGRRMVAGALGMRHPTLTRSHSGGDLGAKVRGQGVALS
jgi:hypothetical protein